MPFFIALCLGFVLLALPGCAAETQRVTSVHFAADAGGLPQGDARVCSTSDCFDAGPAPDGCGDGVLTRDEACDDGNREDGDGCSADCRSVTPGYSCNPPGQPCRPFARCGDGVVAPSEQCDDGNTNERDGCSSRCKLEIGFVCAGEPSVCTETTCGDGVREGSEACDDGNTLPFDGCSSTCQTEPDCAQGACVSECGDGLVIDEECDDGNNQDGDGCSRHCTREAGFTCTTSDSCEMLDGKCVMRVPAIFRDFNASHSDFAVGCGNLVKGVVADTLDARGKPVLANGNAACIASAASFAEWYTSGPNNATIVGMLTLYDNGAGGFVNRWGPNGEPWVGRDMQETFDGDPLFFPIDDAPGALVDTRLRAKVPEQYGYNGWPWEDEVIAGAGLHNFHFTTEVVHWFKYEADTEATLDFSGDDDVWVFVNGRLAVDLGGPHVPESGRVVVDAASAGRFGLSAGNVYPISVFHAERKAEGSSFKLTLQGFNTGRSECVPICGDGVVTLGEECDDGVNDGGYGECAPGCVLGPHCGDGIVQEGEDCDDGNYVDDDACPASCRILQVL